MFPRWQLLRRWQGATVHAFVLRQVFTEWMSKVEALVRKVLVQLVQKRRMESVGLAQQALTLLLEVFARNVALAQSLQDLAAAV